MLALLLQSSPGGLAEVATSLLPIVVLLFISWLLLFRPMAKERKEKEAMRDALKPGDRVMTRGGLYGTVTKMGERTVHLRVASGVDIEFARGAVEAVIPPQEKE